MQFFYRILADVVVATHFALMLFIVLGQLAVLVGIVRKWRWTRNFTFRALHLLTIAIVVAEEYLEITCPLTDWERQLRGLGGQTTYSGDFIPNLLHDLLFFDFEPWVFTVCYSLFGATVLLAFIFAPPRWPFGRKQDTSSAPSLAPPESEATASGESSD